MIDPADLLSKMHALGNHLRYAVELAMRDELPSGYHAWCREEFARLSDEAARLAPNSLTEAIRRELHGLEQDATRLLLTA